jgi:hypothetical protein
MSETLIGTRAQPVAPTVDRFVAPFKRAPKGAVQVTTTRDRAEAADAAAEAARKAVEVTKASGPKRKTRASKPELAPKPPRPMSKAALRRLRVAAKRAAKAKEESERPAKPKPAPPLPLHTAENIRKAVAVRQIAPGEGAIRLAAIGNKLDIPLASALAGWRLVGACPVEVSADLVALARASGGVVKVDAQGATIKAAAFGYRPVAA